MSGLTVLSRKSGEIVAVREARMSDAEWFEIQVLLERYYGEELYEGDYETIQNKLGLLG